jgi:hypothetical protein
MPAPIAKKKCIPAHSKVAGIMNTGIGIDFSHECLRMEALL